MTKAPCVWARCARPAHIEIMQGLAARLAEDGDRITLITTQADHPTTRRDIRAFLDRHGPRMVLWVGGPLDDVTLQIATADALPVVVVDADADTAKSATTRWFPGRNRMQLQRISQIFAQTNLTADVLIRAGADQRRTHVGGPLEPGAPILPYAETERRDIARALQSRPVWLARSVALADVPMLCLAHRFAARRSHRLLLIAMVRNGDDGPAVADVFRAEGFATETRSDGTGPDEATQVYIADLEDEAGLWLRVAPMVFAGGSLDEGALDDPFEAAALGSVVLHGSAFGAYQAQFQRLIRAGASYVVAAPDRLGPAVETLLATDKVAQIAAAGWDVTSSGAELVNRIVALIQLRLDGASVG